MLSLPTILHQNHRCALSILLLTLFCCQSSTITAEESRIWTDKTGQHQIRAKFVDVKSGKARLERPNGTITQVPLSKLSKEDQKYIRSLNKPKSRTRPKKKKSNVLAVGDRVEIDFAGDWEPGTIVSIEHKHERVTVKFDDKPAGFTPSFFLSEIRFPNRNERPILPTQDDQPTGKNDKGLANLTPADMSDIKRLLIDGSNATKAKADPASEKISGWKPRAVRLSDHSDSFDRPLDFSISTTKRPLGVVLAKRRGHDRQAPTHLELVDLKNQKVLGTTNAHPSTEKVYLSPSGSSAITVLTDFEEHDTPDQIDVWEVTRKGLKRSLSFRPYGSGNWPEHEVKWCAWLDDDLFITTNTKGRTILWQAKNAKALYELPARDSEFLQLSPGRNQLAIPSSQGIQLCDPRSGKLIAVVGTDNFQRAKLAFSPSGEKIAAVSSNFVDVVDLPTGKTIRSFPCQGAGHFTDFWWLDEQFLFVANRLIIDVPRRIVAWNYEIKGKMVRPVGDTQWVFLEDRGDKLRMLTPFELPPQEAVNAVANLDAEEILAVTPDASVSVDVQIDKDPILAKEVVAALSTAITEAGLEVAEDQPLRLVARITHGKTEDVLTTCLVHSTAQIIRSLSQKMYLKLNSY